MVESKLIAEFKRPKSVEFKQDEADKNRGVFSAKPYERGFATTVGNSLRRTLISALPGYAVIAVKFDKINNEFQNIKGVLQDTTEIIVNLKAVSIALKDSTRKSRVLHFDIKGKKDFFAKDLAVDETVIIGNPDHMIFSANKEAEFSFDLQVDYGKGFVPAEFFEDSIEVKGTVPMDANYSPVVNVAFTVSKIRVNNRSDFEKLDFEIVTNGTIAPEEALKEAAQILKESYYTFNNVETEEVTSAVDSRKDGEADEKSRIFYLSVYNMPFTVRTHFFLKLNDIREVGQLVTKTDEELKSKKKYSDEVLADINEKLKEKDLRLGMKNISYIQKTV